MKWLKNLFKCRKWEYVDTVTYGYDCYEVYARISNKTNIIKYKFQQIRLGSEPVISKWRSKNGYSKK